MSEAERRDYMRRHGIDPVEDREDCGHGCGRTRVNALMWCSRPGDLTGCGIKRRQREGYGDKEAEDKAIAERWEYYRNLFPSYFIVPRER